jgi:hypothetical protein
MLALVAVLLLVVWLLGIWVFPEPLAHIGDRIQRALGRLRSGQD